MRTARVQLDDVDWKARLSSDGTTVAVERFAASGRWIEWADYRVAGKRLEPLPTNAHATPNDVLGEIEARLLDGGNP